MMYRAVVFLIAVAVATGVGLFIRRGELDASDAQRHWPGTAELRVQDMLLRARPLPAPRRDVIVVAADDRSVQKYGKLPWSRAVWARGLREVQARGAKTAVFDVAFDERTTSAADQAFWRAMAQGRRTVLGMGYDANRSRRWTPDDVRALRFLETFALADNVTLRGAAARQHFPWAFFKPPVSDFTQNARGVGIFLRETDPDAVLRDARLLYLTHVEAPPAATPPAGAPLPASLPESRLGGFEVVLPGLALSAAQQAFGVDKTGLRVEDDAVKVGGSLDPPVVIPIDSFSRMAINYAGPAGTIPSISFADASEGKISPASFRDKVVLFGATATAAEATDPRVTPYGEMPRVEITANAVASILSRSYLARSRGNGALATLIAVGVIAGLLLARGNVAAVFWTGIALAVFYLAVAWGALTVGRLFLPILPVLLALGVSTILAMGGTLLFSAPSRRGPVAGQDV